MARFRPSRLFRRISSRSDSQTTASKDSDPPVLTISIPSTPPSLPIYSRQLRKSSSLPKLRKKLHSAVADAQVEAGVPEAVPEQRESVLILPDAEEEKSVRSEGTHSRKSESETLSGERKSQADDGEERKVDIEDEGERRADVNDEAVVEVGAVPDNKEVPLSAAEAQLEEVAQARAHPILTVEQPTPDASEGLKPGPPRTESDSSRRTESGEVTLINSTPERESSTYFVDEPSPRNTKFVLDEAPKRPSSNIRSFSITDSANAKVLTTLLDSPARHEIGLPTTGSSVLPTSNFFEPGIQALTNMLHRKIWVKRPGASPTLVQIKEDDLVDDARDTILKKYANSLGRTFDPPDMVLHIVTRAEQGQNRTQRALGPEEEMCRTIDTYFPGGQTVEEALVIDTPQRRTPRPSPRVLHNHNSYHAMDEYRPLENGSDYFPPMPAVVAPTIPQTTGSTESRASHQHNHSIVGGIAEHPRSISVLNTGQIAPLPSPGGTTRRHQHRPKYGRQPTTSPTILNHPNSIPIAANPPNAVQPHMVHRGSTRPRMDSSASEAHHPNGIPAPPPLPSPAAPEAPPTNQNSSQPPTPLGGIPGSSRGVRPRKTRKPTPENQLTAYGRRKKESSSASSPHPATSGVGLLDGSVPPINVLIVEDNIINLRILEGLMKRLKVRWQTAMNGQIAVDKWRAGGFHLVLMDIQMPVMTGLQATKEIRRLERVNNIGVFSSASPDEGANGDKALSDEEEAAAAKSKEDDKLTNLSEGLFKSPIIIVALTASSLQSDRHEALAAGCNDFLTKPVNFVWLERKVKEWGCMQALIDFDGWRKWKVYAETQEAGKSEAEKQKDREKEAKEKVKAEKMARLMEKQARMKEERARGKRSSVGGVGELRASSPVPSIGTVREEVVNGGGSATSSLRPGAEVLGESGFELN